MVPDFVKRRLLVYLFGLFIVLAGLGILAVNFSQGTFVDDQGCNWVPMENPETGEAFTSESGLEDYFEENGETIPDSLELQVRNGVLHQKVECSVEGGENL